MFFLQQEDKRSATKGGVWPLRHSSFHKHTIGMIQLMHNYIKYFFQAN